MIDLFNYLDRYPHTPGKRRAQTSRDAGNAMKAKAPTLRDRCEALLKERSLTPDEAAAALNQTVLAIRPRFSELHRLGLIGLTGETRKNISGHKAQVYTAMFKP